MQGDLEQINQKVLDLLGYLQRLAARRMNEAAKSLIDPMVESMLRGMRIDFSQLRRMASGQLVVDPYRILGLDKSASDEEVKKRYRELVHVLHPDKSGTPGTATFFQMVNAAFQTISKERGWQ